MRAREHRSLEQRRRGGGGAHTREGFCPRPEAVMLKEKPKPKPNHTTPFPQTPAELVRYAREVLIRTRRRTRKEQRRERGKGQAPCFYRAGFLQMKSVVCGSAPWPELCFFYANFECVWSRVAGQGGAATAWWVYEVSGQPTGRRGGWVEWPVAF